MAFAFRSPKSELPLVLGGNVFGWSADRDASFAVLDAFLDAGGSQIDTADSYTRSAPGNSGGESETILGQWLTSRGCRDRSVPGHQGRLAAAAGQSARRHHRPRRGGFAAPAADGPHRPVLGPQGRPERAAGGDAGRLRRPGPGRQGALPRRVQLLRRTAAVGTRPCRRAGACRLRGRAAALQPARACRVGERRRQGGAGQPAGDLAVLRAGRGLPDRQVPARRGRGVGAVPLGGPLPQRAGFPGAGRAGPGRRGAPGVGGRGGAALAGPAARRAGAHRVRTEPRAAQGSAAGRRLQPQPGRACQRCGPRRTERSAAGYLLR